MSVFKSHGTPEEAKQTKTNKPKKPEKTEKTGTGGTGTGKSGGGKITAGRTATGRSGAGRTGSGKSGGAKTGTGRTGTKTAARTGTKQAGAKKAGTKQAGTKQAGTAKSTTGAAKKPETQRQKKKQPRQKVPPEPKAQPEPKITAAAPRDAPPLLVRALVMLVAFAAMVAFAVVLSHLTLEPSAASERLTHSNLRPGDSIRQYTDQPAFRDTVKQLGGNILLGAPFGVLLPVIAPRARGLLRVTLSTALVMLLVELVQGALVQGRAFDVDDVLLNASGALLGYLLLGRRLGRAVHPPRRHWWHRWTKKPAAERV